MGATEQLIDSLLALPGERLLEYVAGFAPTGDGPARKLHAVATADGDGAATARLLAADPNVDVDAVDERGCTALMHAARLGNAETVQALLQGGARPELLNADGETALHLALAHGQDRCVALLASDGRAAAVRTRDGGVTALMMAVAAGAGAATVAMLCRACCQSQLALQRTDVLGRTALIHACMGGNAGAAKLLLESKADPDVADVDCSTALHAAAEHGALECAALLLRGGARPDAEDAAGLTPLGVAERAAGDSLRHLATLELLESFGDGEDLTGEVLSASSAVQNLPGPRAVLDVLSELKWQPAGVALQAHEAAGVRKPRPFSQAAGEGTTQSSFEHKVPRVVLERIYRRQRRDSGQRAELAADAAVRVAVQPASDVISTTGAAWPAEVFDRLTAQAPERPTPHVAASKRKEPHGARVRRVLDAETPTFTDVLAAVALAADMRRGRVPAAALPPNALPALVARAVEQLTAQLSQASNGDDVEEMGRVLQSARSGKGELTAAMGGAELQRSVGEALQTAVHECEARRAACRSAHRKLHAAWRAGDPSAIVSSIEAAEALSLPQTTGNDAAPGPLAHLARDFKARHKGLRDAQDLLCEACARISDGVPINADALAHARDVIETCVRYEATAKSREFAQLSAAVAEVQAMAEAGKENHGRSEGNQDGNEDKGGRPPLRTARARRDREAKALQARRSVEVSRYASGRARVQRTEARHQRAREKRGEMAQTEEQRLEELAASATTGDRACAITGSAERTARLAAYHERRDKAVRTKEQLRETAVAAAVASAAARDRQAEEHRARLVAQRQANAAARAQRKSISPRASVQRSAGVVDPIGASGGEPVEVKGSAAFLTTSREQRESSVVVFRGGPNRTGAQPFFYSRSVGGDHRDSGDADGETEKTERAGGWVAVADAGGSATRRVGGRALRMPGRRQRKESQG